MNNVERTGVRKWCMSYRGFVFTLQSMGDWKWLVSSEDARDQINARWARHEAVDMCGAEVETLEQLVVRIRGHVDTYWQNLISAYDDKGVKERIACTQKAIVSVCSHISNTVVGITADDCADALLSRLSGIYEDLNSLYSACMTTASLAASGSPSDARLDSSAAGTCPELDAKQYAVDIRNIIKSTPVSWPEFANGRFIQLLTELDDLLDVQLEAGQKNTDMYELLASAADALRAIQNLKQTREQNEACKAKVVKYLNKLINGHM